jgi:iron complex transport system ATP-binding protein
MNAHGTPALELDQATAGYDGSVVLNGLSVSVARGELVGVIGPNGSGKSTLVKTLSGWLPIMSGRALVQGKPVGQYSATERAKTVAVVAQNIELPFAFSVWDVAMMGRYAHLGPFRAETRQDREVVERSLELTDCARLRERLITNLSGGERQRVMVARALAQQASILLLDEPTNHLDLHHQLGFARLLVELHETEGLTVLWVSHDLNLASEFCERLLLVTEGNVTADGPPHDVLTADVIHGAYGIRVPVQPNPLTGRPQVILANQRLATTATREGGAA